MARVKVRRVRKNTTAKGNAVPKTQLAFLINRCWVGEPAATQMARASEALAPVLLARALEAYPHEAVARALLEDDPT